MNNIALIVSLNFNPGHVSHMLASYRQLEELGYESVYYVDEQFIPYLPQNERICIHEKEKLRGVSLALFLFPSQKNLLLISKLKRQGSKVVYIFHEPLAPLKEYRDAGFSKKYLAKLWVINQISSLTVKWSEAVLLPSKRAVDYYEANPLYKNKNYHYLPLLFVDERTPENTATKRCYFSYIGTVAADHSFNEYLRFVEWATENNRLPNLQFLVATKSQFDVSPQIAQSPRVIIYKGRPLSNAEINDYYASSFVVWNAYSRTTQSGVLAKSFMFGTPAIVLRKNLSEYAVNGKEVVAIDDNTSYEEIEKALESVLNDYDSFSINARDRFMSTFFYQNYNEQFKKIIDNLQS